MKTINKLFLISVLASIGMTSAIADEFLNNSKHFLDDTHYWDDQMFGGLRVNYSLDAVANKDYDKFPQSIEFIYYFKDMRYFLDDTNYWDDQVVGRGTNRSRVNYSISAEDKNSIDSAIYDDVFIRE